MRLPIHGALHYPETAPSLWGELDFDGLNLSFERPDLERFPMLGMAYEALRAGERYTIVYNAANEYAVSAFLDGRIAFTDIGALCGLVLDRDWSGEAGDLRAIKETDRLARKTAGSFYGNRG
jgi:1-deoxy-D-xylulose-5-phosphate reductoisomerase